MQRGLVCFLLMLGYAQSQCVCPSTTQKEVYKNSDLGNNRALFTNNNLFLVAHVHFDGLSVSEDNTFLVYKTTFLDVFKPQNLNETNGLIFADALSKNCNPVNFIQVDGEYLLAAKKSGKNWQIKECVGFPQHSQGRPMIAQPWDLVTNKTLTNLSNGKF